MKLFFSGLLALCCVPAVVAQEAVDTERCEAERAYVREKKKKNWYVEAGAGAQVLFADDASGLGFGQRLTPSLSVAAGKWFSPYWGMRLQARGYGFNGNTGMGGIYVADPVDGLVYGTGDPVRSEVTIRPDGTYRRYMRYLDVHVDFRLRLLDLIGGPGGAGGPRGKERSEERRLRMRRVCPESFFVGCLGVAAGSSRRLSALCVCCFLFLHLFFFFLSFLLFSLALFLLLLLLFLL